MKTTILSLVLASLIMLCSGDESLAGFARRSRQCRQYRTCCPAMIECRGATVAAVQEPEDLELRALLEARGEVLKEIIHLINIHAQAGGETLTHSQVLRANSMLLEAELAAAKSQQERIESFERALKAQESIEEILTVMIEQGAGSHTELLMATAARMKVEIELYKEKTGEWPAPAQAEDPDDDGFSNNTERPASREARRDTLKQAVRRIQVEVEVGRRTSDDLARVNKLVLEAEHESARNQEERISILEKMLEGQIVIEETARSRWEIRTCSESDFLIAKADREEAAINLYKAKNGKWPLSTGRGDEDPGVTPEAEDLELRALTVERRDTLKKIVLLVDANARDGVAQLVDVIDAHEALIAVETELAKAPQERVAFLQEALAKQTDVEKHAKLRMEQGGGARTEFLIAKAARLNVEIQLHKACKEEK